MSQFRYATITAAEALACRNDPKALVALEQRKLGEAGFNFGRPIHAETNAITGAREFSQEIIECPN